MIDYKEAIDRLCLDLRLHRYLYYRYSQQVTTDYCYDMMERMLRNLENQEGYVRADSPTITVGADLYNEELEELKDAFIEKWKDGMKYTQPEIK